MRSPSSSAPPLRLAARPEPTAEQAAAILAALDVVMGQEEAAGPPELPWPYRSAWRRAAIAEGVRRVP